MSEVANNADRFEALFRAHSRDILGYALRRLGTRETAADAMAEVFSVAWRKIGDIPEGDAARLWLFGVARNVVRNQHRSNWRRRNLASKLVLDLTIADLEPEMQDTSEVETLLTAMKGLREDERELLQLVFWDGFEPSQAARLMGIPATTARTKLHKARVKIRTALVAQGLERLSDSGHMSVDGAFPAGEPERSGNER